MSLLRLAGETEALKAFLLWQIKQTFPSIFLLVGINFVDLDLD